MRRAVTWLVLVLLALVCFAWGVAYGRYYAFPYSLVQRIEGLVSARTEPAVLTDTASGGVRAGTATTLEMARALGYVEAGPQAPPDLAAGVSTLDSSRMQEGLSLYTSSLEDEAVLLDETGHVVHRWTLPRDAVWWDSPLADRQQFVGWRAARLLPDMSLLAVYDYMGTVCLDRDSTVVWVHREGDHHDLWLADGGEIFVLTHSRTVTPELNPTVPIVDDHVTVLDSDGRELRSTSLVELMRSSPFAGLLPTVNTARGDYALDILHTNSVTVVDQRVPGGRSGLMRPGRVILSMRNISTVVVADLDAEEILWAWGPATLAYQHSARLLAGGSIVLFDNHFGDSRVVAVDPASRWITWATSGPRERPLGSQVYGGCEPLDNGNILVVDSLNGRCLEITPDGRVVWRLQLAPRPDGRLPVLYGVQRYPRSFFDRETREELVRVLREP